MTNLCDPHVVAMDIVFNSTDMEHMRVRIEAELNRWRDALANATCVECGSKVKDEKREED